MGPLHSKALADLNLMEQQFAMGEIMALSRMLARTSEKHVISRKSLEARLAEVYRQLEQLKHLAAQRKNSSKMSSCMCSDWTRTNGFLTRHHPNCPLYAPEKDAIELISDLLQAMRCWGADEDGIPDHAVPAFNRACVAIGEKPLPERRP